MPITRYADLNVGDVYVIYTRDLLAKGEPEVPEYFVVVEHETAGEMLVLGDNAEGVPDILFYESDSKTRRTYQAWTDHVHSDKAGATCSTAKGCYPRQGSPTNP